MKQGYLFLLQFYQFYDFKKHENSHKVLKCQGYIDYLDTKYIYHGSGTILSCGCSFGMFAKTMNEISLERIEILAKNM